MHFPFLTVTAHDIWIAGGSAGLLLAGVAMKNLFTTKASAPAGPPEAAQTSKRLDVTSEDLPGVKPSLTSSGRSAVRSHDEFAFMVSQLA
jgi:hypothetical protein